MDKIWQYTFLNNTTKEWVICLAIISVILILLRTFTFLVLKKVGYLAAKTKSTLDDFILSAVRNSVVPAMYVFAFYFGLSYLTLPSEIKAIIRIALLISITFFAIRALSSLAKYFFDHSIMRDAAEKQRDRQSKGILLIIQIILWLGGFLFLIDNLGYDITTIVAGLGIGGIAIALAAQTILGDLFSYLVIFFDKPFEVGDFIIIDDKMGTVEYIGIKTTRLRTLGGEQLICSNTDLTDSRVHNYKRMEERRVVFSFGVVYETEQEKLKAIPRIAKEAVLSLDHTRFDRAHFKSFGDFSLNFEVVYYVLSADYNVYMDKQQAINLKLFKIFKEQNIDFAFPTQTIFLNTSSNYQRQMKFPETIA